MSLLTELTMQEKLIAQEEGILNVQRDLLWECDICEDELTRHERHSIVYQDLCDECARDVLSKRITCEVCEYYVKNHAVGGMKQECSENMFLICPCGAARGEI